MDVQVERRTFVGHDGRDEIAFVCIKGNRYSILRNNAAVGIWGITDFAYCLGIYLRMIERSTQRAVPIGDVRYIPAESTIDHLSARAC
jgi:hypothetical protein